MRDNPEGSIMERIRPKSSILDMLKPAEASPTPEARPVVEFEAESPTGEAIIPLPQPGDPYDTAHARSSNKPLPTLRFIRGENIRGLPYANLDSIDWLPSEKPGLGPMIVLRFAGIIAREARISGRNLLLLYDLLAHHRVAWVRELPLGRDFKEGKATVITGITVGPVTEFPA
jgi:hypothetical protein